VFDASVGGYDQEAFSDPVTAVAVLIPIAVVDGRRRWCGVVARCSVIHRRRRIITITATRCDRRPHAEAHKTSNYRCASRITTTTMMVIMPVMPAVSMRSRGYG
jgi:hypothetical protein